ncbi:hypothetical protein B0H14DRAFT_2568883 [Mycena olivaceomarginata]|nr:hypothetical protein B0H14DRAFT_2568883 [Mycena olivaceomarginata]
MSVTDKSLVEVMTGIHPSQRLPIVPIQGIEYFNFGPESMDTDVTWSGEISGTFSIVLYRVEARRLLFDASPIPAGVTRSLLFASSGLVGHYYPHDLNAMGSGRAFPGYSEECKIQGFGHSRVPALGETTESPISWIRKGGYIGLVQDVAILGSHKER